MFAYMQPSRTPKKPFIENKMCDYHIPKINMALVRTCACDRTSFMARTRCDDQNDQM